FRRETRCRRAAANPIVVEQVSTANRARDRRERRCLLESAPDVVLGLRPKSPMSEPTHSVPPAGEPAAPTGSSGAAPGAAAGAAPAPPAGAEAGKPSGVSLPLRASTARPGLSRFLWVGVALVVLAGALAAWFEERRERQQLRTEVAQRLSGVEAAV